MAAWSALAGVSSAMVSGAAQMAVGERGCPAECAYGWTCNWETHVCDPPRPPIDESTEMPSGAPSACNPPCGPGWMCDVSASPPNCVKVPSAFSP
jgi:hypothetical protein